MGAVALDHLPEPDRLEVAFAGRSNVGKSSLINALTNQKGLARASGEPGRTRELNFFNVEGGHNFRTWVSAIWRILVGGFSDGTIVSRRFFWFFL